MHCNAYGRDEKAFAEKLPSRVNDRDSVRSKASEILVELRRALSSVGLMDAAPSPSPEGGKVADSAAASPASRALNPPGAPTGLQAEGEAGSVFLYYPEVSVSRSRVSTACALGGKQHASDEFDKMPGGAKSKRPWLFPFPQRYIIRSKSGDPGFDFLLEVVVTSRGESSIAKDWRLCLEYKRSPQWFRPEASDGQFTQLPDGTSLADVTVHEPVKHGSAAKGWLLFRVPQEVLTSQDVLTGSIECRDYLDHRSSMAFGPRDPGRDGQHH